MSIQDEFENFEAAMEGHETAYHFFEAGWNARGKTIETALGAAKVLSEGKQEPVAWVRRHPDGALTAEFLEDDVVEPVRKKSGAWVPFYTEAPAVAIQDELELHRADYQACKNAGFESPGELLSAYKTLLAKQAPAVAQQPVHFRAVLCREQQDQAIGVVPKVVGFVDKKAAEQFILEKRDFQGWRYNLEPLFAEAPPAAEVNAQLLEALNDFSNYVRTEQSSTDGQVQFSNTQINRLAFKARAAIAAAEAKMKEQAK